MGLALFALALGAAYGASRTEPILVRLFGAHVALGFFGVALAQWLGQPRLLLKRADGRLSCWSWLIFWPYHLLSHLSYALYRLSPREDLFHEIQPGLFLGCRLPAHAAARLAAQRPWSVLDLTSEFSEAVAFRTAAAYLCLPLLDHTAPTVDQLHQGCAFLSARLPTGPVYVHCAVGHGRSATFVAAYLLASGGADSPEQAIAFLKARRPGVHINAAQRTVLHAFGQTLPSR
jgi:hypothetical protein